jgi:threonine/homoserine/homoserine lactone efflux protein
MHSYEKIMFGIHDLTLFIVSGFLLNIMPGPDSLFIMTKSGAHGWRAGSVASLGIGTGVFVHILAAALGLSAILAASATAFTLVKILGAAYLVYLGIATLLQKTKNSNRAATEDPGAPSGLPLSMKAIYWQGFLTNVLNPKVALFFLAFVPQFIAPDSMNKALAFVILGFIFNVNSMLWCHFLAIVTASASRRVQVSYAAGRWLNTTVGVLFISLGLKLALSANK